ncbi:TIR domain-containing protein [Collimonas fungivorans]|uniref:TIR domain-containing protein n=1 Tax=Collimonas fungivorans TaxID=158899 RepID=UPI00059F78F1|nr:nucleotide-binding protein [Collimonas fungivorans]
MSDISIAMAKLAGIQKSVQSALGEDVSRNRGGIPQHRRSFNPMDVVHYFKQAAVQLAILQKYMPDWYSDFHQLPLEPELQMMATPEDVRPMHFSRAQMERLVRDIEQLFEIRANSQHSASQVKVAPRKVFISHGRSKDWYEVQAHIEKDLMLMTMELAQEPSKGQTIIEKLEANSEQCDSAVIVMSGDDADADGQARVRENVMHEIGYFQGKYSRQRVVLLHEEGVSVPTNLSGIVYVAYPKGVVSATFGVLDRELKAIYGL